MHKDNIFSTKKFSEKAEYGVFLIRLHGHFFGENKKKSNLDKTNFLGGFLIVSSVTKVDI